MVLLLPTFAAENERGDELFYITDNTELILMNFRKYNVHEDNLLSFVSKEYDIIESTTLNSPPETVDNPTNNSIDTDSHKNRPVSHTSEDIPNGSRDEPITDDTSHSGSSSQVNEKTDILHEGTTVGFSIIMSIHCYVFIQDNIAQLLLTRKVSSFTLRNMESLS